jgi:hypothetical protein
MRKWWPVIRFPKALHHLSDIRPRDYLLHDSESVAIIVVETAYEHQQLLAASEHWDGSIESGEIFRIQRSLASVPDC